MATTNEGRIRALLFTSAERKEYHADHESLDLSAVVVTCDKYGERVRNVSDSYYEGTGVAKPLEDRDLMDLAVSATASTSFPDLRPYGHRVAFSQPYIVELARAEGMAKVLKHVGKYLEKKEAQDGPSESVGQFFVRVAQAVGATRVLFERDRRGHSYDDNAYLALELGMGASKINAVLETWQAAKRAAKEGAVAS